MKQEFTQESHENDDPSFVDKLKSLLPDVEFKESDDMLEARTAILQALVSKIPIFYQPPGMNTPMYAGKQSITIHHQTHTIVRNYK